MALKFNCQGCNELIISKFLKKGEIAKCKKCGSATTIPEDAEGITNVEIQDDHTISDVFNKETKIQLDSSIKESIDDNSQKITEVVIADIKMPFGSMVEFILKWTIASIPAMIILFFIGLIIMTFLAGLGVIID